MQPKQGYDFVLTAVPAEHSGNLMEGVAYATVSVSPSDLARIKTDQHPADLLGGKLMSAVVNALYDLKSK